MILCASLLFNESLENLFNNGTLKARELYQRSIIFPKLSFGRQERNLMQFFQETNRYRGIILNLTWHPFLFFSAAISRQQVDKTDITIKKNRIHCEKSFPLDHWISSKVFPLSIQNFGTLVEGSKTQNSSAENYTSV